MAHPSATLDPALTPPVFDEKRSPRCDRDQGEASVIVVHTPAGDLFLCGHHYREHFAALMPYETTSLTTGVHPFPYRLCD